MIGAPPLVSSPGWNMNTTSPASSACSAEQDLGRADESRDMEIVAAGMHHPGVLRHERYVDPLGHRQRVHVATQQDDGTRSADRPAVRR